MFNQTKGGDMKPLTQEQIEAVISWMNGYDQIRNTLIPVRFRGYFEAELKDTKQMEPYLIMTEVEILEKDLVLPKTIIDGGAPRMIQGELTMTLGITVKGSGDISDYVKNRELNEERIMFDVIEGRLKVLSVNEI
jgi:hypothetical protein